MGKQVLLALAIAGLFVHHAFFYYGHFGFDEMTYAEMADNLRRGQIDHTHPFSYRVVTIGLVGLSYSLFGINDWASALPALLASALIVFLLYRIFRKEPWWALLLAYAAYFGMRWNLFYSDKLMGDILVSGTAFAAWFAHHQYTKGALSAARAGILAVTCLFLSFCAKGNVVLLAPLFLCYGIADLLAGRYRFWFTFGLTGCLLAFAYGGVYWWLTGDPLNRFWVIDNHHYLNSCSYDELSPAVLLDRLTAGFWRMLATSGLIPHALLAPLALAILALKRQFRSPVAFYPATALVCFLSIEFMTISPSSYNPICEDPRHILLFGPILTTCSVFSVLGLIRLVGFENSRWSAAGVLLLSALLVYPGLKLANYNRSLKYPAVKERFADMVVAVPKPAIIYGSEATRTLNRYFLDFRPEEQGIRFANYEDAPPCGTATSDTISYVARTWYTDWHSETSSIMIDTALAERGYTLTPFPLGVSELEFYRLDCN